MNFNSLKLRVLIWFGSVTAIILVVFSYAFYYTFEQSINLKIQNLLYDKAIFIKDSIVSKVPLNQILNDNKLDLLDVGIIKNNKIINKKGNTNFENLLIYIKKKDSFFIIGDDELRHGLFKLKIDEPFNGEIMLLKKDIENKAENIEDILWILEPILLLALIFAASRLIDKILNPIIDITQTAKEISISDLSQTIKQPKNENEIKELVDSFNGMLKRLKEGIEKLDRFNSDVSHELRSPLTVIKGEIEVTSQKSREPEYYQKSIGIILYEANKMQQIVDNLLLLTKYTNENIKNTFTNFSLDSLLLEVIEAFNSEIKRKNIHLNLKKLETIDVEANYILMRTIFSNVIDNAIKYSGNGKNIFISLYKNEKIKFIIEDQGIGIRQVDISKITDKFYRVDESRNKQIDGFGLGLAIVKYAIELHHAKLIIKSQEGTGTIISIDF